MKDKNIFIHIPKTGGTTINAAMHNKNWQTEPNFNYRHIILKTKKSNAGDIFNPNTFEMYKDYNIFMMLRHPVDRVLSEYYFIKERKNFIDLLDKTPTSLKSYIKNRQTQNGVINFLKGRRMYDKKIATTDDLDDILDAIDQLSIHVGIFENFSESLQYFQQKTNLVWQDEIEVKRITFRRPKASEVSQDIKDLILEHNQLDLQLYEYALNKFNSIKNTLAPSTVTFNKDKYTHIIPYAAQMCLFEFCMQHKKYINQNKMYFRDLTFHLLKDLQIKDGLQYTKLWNHSFVNAVEDKFPNTPFSLAIQAAFDETKDPLDITYAIAQAVDKYFKENALTAHAYYQAMSFEKSLIPTIVSPKIEQNKKGFFSRLFKK